MTPRSLLRSIAPALALAALLPACGGADPDIPPDTASALVQDMNTVKQGVRAGECRETQSTLERIGRTVGDLPDDTSEEVRTTLDGGVGHLQQLARTQCKEKPPKPVEEEFTPLAPPVETTPEPDPTPTYTAPEEQPEEKKPQEEQPSEGDGPAADPQPKKSKPKKFEGDGLNPCPPDAGPNC